MIPFRVQCETCQSRLRVRDASVVGQVHACPKCGSMVHLVPPPDQGVGSAVAAVSGAPVAAANKPPAAAPDSVLIPPTSAPPTSLPQATPDFGEVDQLEQPVAAAPEAEPAGLAPAAEGNPLVVAPAETSARWIGLATAGLGTTLFLAVGLAYVLTRGGDEPAEVAAATVEAPAAFASESLTPPATDLPATGSTESAPTEPGPTTPEPTESEPTMPEPVPQEAFQPTVTASEPELPELPAVDPPLPPAIEEAKPEPPVSFSDSVSTEETSVTPEPQAEPAAVAPFDPLDFDAASLDLILTRGGPAKEAAPAEPAAPEPQPQAVLDDRLAANAGMPPADGLLQGQLDGRLEGRAADARALVRRGPTGPAPPTVSDPLAVVVPEVQIAEAPLDRVLRLLADVAGVRLTLPPESLQLAGVAADTPVSLRGANATIGRLFDQVLTPRRLEIEQQAAGLIVKRVGGDKRRTSSYRVDDLAWPAANDGAIAELIADLLPNLDAQVSSANGRLTVDGPAAAHMRVAILCERIRKARGLPQQSRYPAALLAVDPPHLELKRVMSRPTTFSFVAFTPLAEVVDYWRQATGLVVLVDNAALSEIDLRPTTTLACSVDGRPWGEALDAVLGELGLVWRAVDARTIEITTAQAADARATVEFYPADTPDAAEAIIAAASGHAQYDPTARRVLFAGTDAQHREASQTE